jgi:NitT/TauT family transport system substrate-binding protein
MVATAPPALTAVRLGTLNATNDATYYLAEDRGYLREEGLELAATPFDTGLQMIAPLGADQLDVGGGALGPGVFNAALRDINVRIVADRARVAPGTTFHCLMARKSLLDGGGLRTAADLRGRTFAEPAPGNIATSVLESELRRAGLRPDELRYVTMPFPDMLVGFANEVVDVAFLTEPFYTLAADRGVGQCWQYTAEMMPNFQLAVLLYGPAFAEQRADVARRFTVAYLRGVRDYYRAFFGDGVGRGEILELQTHITPIKDVALLARVAPTWLDPDGAVNVDSLRASMQWLHERGDLAVDVDVDRMVDMRFVDYALGRLGRYQAP